MLLTTFALSALLQSSLVAGAAISLSARSTSVTATLSSATVTGISNGTVDQFLGIPFAQPPVGDLRLQLPQLLTSYNGSINATAFGNQCVQQSLIFPSGVSDELLGDILPFVSAFGGNPSVLQSEDCLNLNVIRPTGTTSKSKLPVVVWMYGGGFAFGSNAVLDGTQFVQTSVNMNEPVIYVAMNYRIHALGFLGGQEVKDAGIANLGLQDQRAALRWVQKYISAFGGDPKKVTIWGQSAGAISVSLQMLANNGNNEGLFRAAIMNSGGPPPTGDITETQSTFDFIVDQVGCSSASDKLACLRGVDIDTLMDAVNQTPTVISYAGLNTPFMPRADGSLISYNPQKMALDGKLTNVPFIIGDTLDEGTLFSLGSMNITTDAEFEDYVSTNWFSGMSWLEKETLMAMYPSDPAAGSPFGTGDDNEFTPEYKRIAAMQGDWIFQVPRRQLLDRYSWTRTTYSYLSSRGDYPGVGIGHGSDLFNAYGGGDMAQYFVQFINKLDPNLNKKGCAQWPQFNSLFRWQLEFTNDDSQPTKVSMDTYRLLPMLTVSALSLEHPF